MYKIRAKIAEKTRERLFLWQMTKTVKKTLLENGKLLGLYLENNNRKKISVRKSHVFFGKYLKKRVIGNLAYREMLFYKKALVMVMVMIDRY